MSSTLTGWKNERNNFFSALLQASKSGDGEDGGEPVFIDRDPECFRVILNYLRTGHLNPFAVGLQQLRVELAYFGVPEPEEWGQTFQQFQQWARGVPGEIRAVLYDTDVEVFAAGGCMVLWYASKNEVHDAGWQGPCKSFAPSTADEARFVLLKEMGKLGWELKAVTTIATLPRYYLQMRA